MKNRNDQDDDREYTEDEAAEENPTPRKKKRRAAAEGEPRSWKQYIRAGAGVVTLLAGGLWGGGYYYYYYGGGHANKADNPLQGLKEAQAAVEQGAQQLAEGSPSVDQVLQDPQQAAGQFVDNATQALNDTTNQLQQTAGQAVDQFTQQASQAVDQFTQDAQQTAEQYTQQAQQAGDQFVQQAGEAGQQVTQAVDEALAPRAGISARSAAGDVAADLSQSLPPQESFPAAEGQGAAGSAFESPPVATSAMPDASQGQFAADPNAATNYPPAETAPPQDASQQPSAFAETTSAPPNEQFGSPPQTSGSPFPPATEAAPATTDTAGEFTPQPRSSRRRASIGAAPLAQPETPPAEFDQASTTAPQRDEFTAPSARGSSAPASPSSAEAGTYTVAAQDNYWVISQKLYGDGAYFKALFEHNRDRYPRANKLRVGDVISTPPAEVLAATYPQLMPRQLRPAAASRDVRGTAAAVPASGPRAYVVIEGDTLFDIARNELGDSRRWSEIYELNRQALGNNVDRLKPGTQLNLPGTDGSTATNRTSRRLR